jgi:hypothetical protein
VNTVPAIFETDFLGHLRLIETYLFYDGPKLFACRNGYGQVFIAVWTEDGKDGDTWILAPVSTNRFNLLRQGQIDLRTILARPEDGTVFLLQTHKSTGELIALAPVLGESLSDDDLPEPGQFLKPEVDENLALAHLPPNLVAKQAWRPALDVRLKLPPRYGTRAPARLLAGFISPLQDTLDAMVYGNGVDLALKGRLPSGMLAQTEMAVQMTYPSSFGIVMTATEQADLFGNSTVALALDRLVELFATGGDKERLRELLQATHKRAAYRYGRLLGALVKLNASIDLSWSSPDEQSGRSASMSAQVIRDAIGIVNEAVLQMPEEIVIQGELIGLNVRLANFEVSETPSGRRYSGKIAPDASGVEHAIIRDKYTVRIEKVVETLATTGNEVVHWQLLGLLPPEQIPPSE